MQRIFKLVFIMAVVVMLWKQYQQHRLESRLRHEQAVLERKNKEIEQLRASCKFPDGYVKTGSGYWFNIKEFTDDVSKYRKDYTLALDKNYDEALTYYLRFKQVHGQCQLEGMSKVLFWNGHELLEFEQLLPAVDRQDKDIAVHVEQLVKNTNGLSRVDVSICYEQACSMQPLDKPAQYIYTTCHNPRYLPLSHYKDLKLRVNDCDVKDGYVKQVDGLANEFVYTGNTNFGHPYEFYCTGLLTGFEGKKVNLKELVSIFDATGKKDCQWAVTSTYPRNQLYFYGGRYSITFNTSVLATLGELIQHTRAFATRYLSKEKPVKQKPKDINPAVNIAGDFK